MREPTREEMVEGIARGMREWLSEKWSADGGDDETLQEIIRDGVMLACTRIAANRTNQPARNPGKPSWSLL